MLFIGLVAAGVAVGAIYALVALGFVFTYRSVGTFNFFHGEISMVGAMVAFLIADGTGTPLAVAIGCGVLAALALALLGDRLVFARLEGAPTLAALLATAAFGMFMVRGVAEGVFGVVPQRLPAMIEGVVSIGGVAIRKQDILALVVLGVILLIFWAVFRSTQIGRAMRAVSDQPLAAAVVGINARATRTLALGIAGVVGGIAGVLIAPVILVSPIMGGALMMKAFVCALVGGLTSFRGAVVVGILLGVLETLTAYYWSAEMRDLVPFAMMMVVLLLMPEGLLGQREVARL
jgi:branched-subunit amino acid ABC-type transport system permease component